MAQPPKAAILKHFAELDDPRVERTRRHKLVGILATALMRTHCEERSDGAVSLPEEPPGLGRDCHAALAMTGRSRKVGTRELTPALEMRRHFLASFQQGGRVTRRTAGGSQAGGYPR